MASGSPQQPPTGNQGQVQSRDRPESPTVPQQRSEAPQMDAAESKNHDLMAADPFTQQQPARRTQVKTPEPKTSTDHMNGHKDTTATSPSTPGHLAPFDWDEFEGRYEQALAEANNQEKELLEEFDRLVKYFNVWASAASVHDNERGAKRLQTRERYVKIAEQSLVQKKKHLTEVVRAFQSALALLSQN
ncbi:hypothetical protein CONLIGDRAFT_125620 [Coniochaeta ligniaria NRRL 30616]|uniref:Uncharacterized protein n=1 Tax=Coniochaeta ligniaria NRRL 30616 TaxID=1408157 RepID=A0A1J7I9U9_9PEZI|nr:hypothetical protein CONLIGDRAFT_125620 [Coniochaeta ligniaria NRRL 30616]